MIHSSGLKRKERGWRRGENTDESVGRQMCSTVGCNLPASEASGKEKFCEICLKRKRQSQKIRKKHSVMKKEGEIENRRILADPGLESWCPIVVWYKDNPLWMSMAKEELERKGCVILRSVLDMNKGDHDFLEAMIKSHFQFRTPNDGGILTGRTIEEYLDDSELEKETKLGQVLNHVLGVVLRYSRYANPEYADRVDGRVAAMMKGRNCAQKQSIHADDVFAANVKALLYLNEKSLPVRILPYGLLHGEPIDPRRRRLDFSQDNRDMLVRRFSVLFEGEHYDNARATNMCAEVDEQVPRVHALRKQYEAELKPIRETCEKGDMFLFAGDLGHAGWSNSGAEEKNFLFINTSVLGKPDTNWQFHVGEYGNARFGYGGEDFYGEQKMDLVKDHMKALGWTREECKAGLEIFFPFMAPTETSSVESGVCPGFETPLKTKYKWAKWIKERATECAAAVRAYEPGGGG